MLINRNQVPKTADRFFTNATELWLLKVLYEKVESRIKWEGNSKGVFPHIYDKNLDEALGEREVEIVIKGERGEGKTWTETLVKVLE
jgi:uncharacterized protein (DUF952 family)